MIRSDQIKTIVRQYGLSAVGVSSPVLNEKYYHVFETWLKSGYYGDMDWVLRTQNDRRNIQKRYPWVRSALVALDNYYSEPIVARNGLKYTQYAVGRDYHKTIKNKLQNVLSSLKKFDENIQGKIYVDSGPLLEKAFAEQAGLGWIGKNGVFIGNEIGSFCFIGVLLLSIDLVPGKPSRNLCGGCQKCIEACPNSAIVEPGLLDCKRCISYLTVEKKGCFNNNESSMIHDWVYGCDICQNVCPWNEKWATQSQNTEYYLHKNDIQDYIEFANRANLDKFNRVFENTPAARVGYEQMTRNIDTALQNVTNRKSHE